MNSVLEAFLFAGVRGENGLHFGLPGVKGHSDSM